MSTIHIKNFKGGHVHFVGIGGISMSGLAEILIQKKYTVSGSDLNGSDIVERLKNKGARIFSGHEASNIDGADLVVHTAAVKEDNPELVRAREQGIPVIDRAELLGQIMESFPSAIGVSGTHGKTTTTSILSIIIESAGLDPTILLGGQLDEIGGNVRVGNSGYFLTEACEYVESFLKFHPFIALVLNIDKDHMDYFRDMDHIYSSFLKFASLVPKRGFVIGCADDPLVLKLLGEVNCRTISYSIEGSGDWNASRIEYDNKGCPTYRASYKGQDMGKFTLNVPGRHNIYNALAATAASLAMGISMEIVRDSLLLYKGVHRRFEIKGTVGDVMIVDDYAHHPTEIKATLSALGNYTKNKVWCVFQPHTYTRTKKLFNEFLEAFNDTDELIIADIYAAREKDTGDISSRILVDELKKKGISCVYLPSFDDIVDYLAKNTAPNDIVITMGAGNIHEVGEALLKRLS